MNYQLYSEWGLHTIPLKADADQVVVSNPITVEVGESDDDDDGNRPFIAINNDGGDQYVQVSVHGLNDDGKHTEARGYFERRELLKLARALVHCLEVGGAAVLMLLISGCLARKPYAPPEPGARAYCKRLCEPKRRDLGQALGGYFDGRQNPYRECRKRCRKRRN